jgi:hypothetical protein
MRRGLSGYYEVTAAFGEQVRAFAPAHRALRCRSRHPSGASGSGAAIFRLRDHFQSTPITSAPRAAEAIQSTLPTPIAALRKLEILGNLRELTGGSYRRNDSYTSHLDLLNEGTEPFHP